MSTYASGGTTALFVRNDKHIVNTIYTPEFQDAVTYAMQVAFQSTGFNTDFSPILAEFQQRTAVFVAAPAGNYTVSSAQNQTQLISTPIANNVATLPTTASMAGRYITFLVRDVPNGVNSFTINAGAAIIDGFIVAPAAAAGVTNQTAKTTVTFSGVAANTKIGDKVTLFSTGARWIMEAYSSGAASGISAA